MKYIAPEFATVVVETEDVILTSGTFVPGDDDGNATTPDEEL